MIHNTLKHMKTWLRFLCENNLNRTFFLAYASCESLRITLYMHFLPAGCTCTLWGDSHLITFDGNLITTSGDCEYVLVENFGNSTFPPYRVIANNVKDYPSSAVAFTRSVRLEVEGNIYNIISGGSVFINGVQELLPFKDELVTVYELYPQKRVSKIYSLHCIPLQNHFVTVLMYQERWRKKECSNGFSA